MRQGEELLPFRSANSPLLNSPSSLSALKVSARGHVTQKDKSSAVPSRNLSLCRCHVGLVPETDSSVGEILHLKEQQHEEHRAVSAERHLVHHSEQ